MNAEPARQAFATFTYRRSPDQDRPAHHPIVIVGAGPVGLALAIDLAQRGIRAVVLDDSDRIGDGSRAICFAKRTLEVLQRLGAAAPALAKGVEWQVGKVFHKDRQIYGFDLLPEPGHRMPAFINIQQYYIEKFLVDRALATGLVDLRWCNRVTAITNGAHGVTVSIDTPDGAYQLDADWLVACDGARSPVRDMLGLPFEGERFEDQFLIADVKMTAAFPVERWFWFEPPFHSGQSALLHKQPDDVWRIDLQLSPDADVEHEKRPEVVRPRIAQMLGHDDFELEWVSIYRFQCRRLARFVHDRVIFAGDAAHLVSPFGARGANSGIQDAENLAWKLAAVIERRAPTGLIATYHHERSEAADENIANSTRATDFIAPRSHSEKVLRDATLALAGVADFAKRLVNSGRLSMPTAYAASPLSTPDRDVWTGGPMAGAPIVDCPLVAPDGRLTFLSEALGAGFTLVATTDAMPPSHPEGVTALMIGGAGGWQDVEGQFAKRFDATTGAAYLVRPDTHVAARWRRPDAAALAAALDRAHGR
jgi:3-(3-hydroxy-phenyl)propionate hydroxylase